MLHGLKDKIRSFNVENTNRKFRKTIWKKKKLKYAIRKEEKENVQKKNKSVQCNSIKM